MLDRFKVPEEDKVYVPVEKITKVTENILKSSGVSEDGAKNSTSVLIGNDLRGVETHGVSNGLRLYVEKYASGQYNSSPDIKIVRESATTATIDGDNGLGAEIGPLAMDMAIEKAEKYGMGCVVVSNTGHLAGCGYYPLQAVEKDMIGQAMTSGGAGLTVPTWGSEPILGTNPVAWAAPADEMPPFLFDIATTQIASNKIGLAVRTGAKILPGWITDKDGEPILEEVDAPQRSGRHGESNYHLLPFGGTRENGSHKGFGLGMVVEIMTNELSGMGPAPVLHHEGSDMFAAYSIDAFTDVKKFKKDMDLLLNKIVDSKPASDYERVVYAGLMESEEYTKRSQEGIPYHKEVIEWFENYCSEIGIDCELR
tara:strand:- start:10234 stop:11337 length:1104 start_codon:yes stop_codon:yes gene_type:complete